MNKMNSNNPRYQQLRVPVEWPQRDVKAVHHEWLQKDKEHETSAAFA